MSPGDITILWDFDNTLFRTRAFWREVLFPELGVLNIDAEKAECGFKNATLVKRDYFVPEIVASSIAKASGTDTFAVLQIVERVVYSNAGSRWFFPGALDAVHTLNQKGYRRYLLSYGDEPFKRRWFSSIGMRELFLPKEIVITSQKKSAIVQSLELTARVIIVNDVLEDTHAVAEILRMVGHTVSAYHFVADPGIVSTLPEEPDLTYFSDFNVLTKSLSL